MDISQKLEVTAIFSDLAKKGGKELKAKNQRKLAGKLRGRVGKACALGMCTGPEWGESRAMGKLSGIHVVRVVDGGQ